MCEIKLLRTQQRRVQQFDRAFRQSGTLGRFENLQCLKVVDAERVGQRHVSLEAEDAQNLRFDGVELLAGRLEGAF